MKEKTNEINLGVETSTVYAQSVTKNVGAGDSARSFLKRNTQKGITLIALIISIIIMLILAVVSINIIQNQEIIAKSQKAVDKYNEEAEKELIQLGYTKYMTDKYMKKTPLKLDVEGAKVTGDEENGWTITFANGNVYTLSADGKTIELSQKDWKTAETITSKKINKVLSETKNTKLKDEYGNKVVVPAGFKIKVEPDTNNATHVTEGIVIQDKDNNEFVWIPVGNIKTSKEDTTGTQITLGRYLSFKVGATPVQTLENHSEIIKIDRYFIEYFSSSNSLRAIAKDVKVFLTSANNNGGFYLGRYEARTGTERVAETDSLTTLTENKNDYVYNYVTQLQASERCQGMYTGKPFTSDLINSYSWDTAIMFIESFGENKSYAFKESVNTSYANKGTEADKELNIYDMASNCVEWSTESDTIASDNAVRRGGEYGEWGDKFRADWRCSSSSSGSFKDISFRPVLYV